MRSRSVEPPPLKGILKTNQPKQATSTVEVRWPPPAAAASNSCCCCVGGGLNEWDLSHPDDPTRNYVSHCHTENRLWRPEAVVIQHRDLTSKTQLQTPSHRVSHNQILYWSTEPCNVKNVNYLIHNFNFCKSRTS